MNGFTFFQNYFDAINDEENGLTEEEQGRLYNAIFAYMFRDEEPSLKGACRMAFNLIKPSLDRSKQNGKNKSKNESETETQSNEMEQNGTQMETEKSPFFEKEEERNKKEEDNESVYPPACACEEEIAEGYLCFLREHPSVSVDITNPSLIASVDYAVLSEKISESRYLQSRRSLHWLIKNYRKIVLDSYKDYAPPALPVPEKSQKGDLQLWSEFTSARNRAKEERTYNPDGAIAPLFRMMDERAKETMGELYRGLSPEIRAYFDPTAFLDVCEMDDADLKFERARFLKALNGIRRQLAEEVV